MADLSISAEGIVDDLGLVRAEENESPSWTVRPRIVATLQPVNLRSATEALSAACLITLM